jgi:MoaA/NifB/PqqE/SkfB family radical SAM enzyme
LLKDYGNWCPEIYRGMFIDRHNSDHVQVAPCCQAHPSIEKVENFDFNTSPHLTQLRQRFDRGEKPFECNRCWQAEKLGSRSRRQSSIEFWQLPEIDRSVLLESIDYNATWGCNLACVMCNPGYSSLWAKQKNLDKNELAKIGRYFRNHNNVLNNIDVTGLKQVHFNGGEPLLNDDHTDLLIKLEKQGVLKTLNISYNTNGTIMPNNKTIDLWSQAHLVKLYFSIDAVGSAFEYVRWPGVWSQTCKNMLDMKRDLPSNVMFGFNSTVGCYNLFEIQDVWHWFDQNISTNREGDVSDFCWQFANNFDLKWLNSDIKKIAIEQLKSISDLNGIVKYLESQAEHKEDPIWIKSLSELDLIRGTNWMNSLKIAKYIKEKSC